MDRDRFEARLKAEGYPEIRTNELPANRRNPEHTHPFDVLALVLEGEITLTVEGSARTYRPGDEFSMKAGCAHAEDIGPAGVSYLVGRRPTTPQPAENKGKPPDHAAIVRHVDDFDWETIRWPGESGKMLFHPRPGAPDEPNAGLLRLEPGAHHPLHRHDFAQIWYILEGTFSIGGRKCGPGAMLYHPDPHFEDELRTETGGLMLIVQYPGPVTGGRPIYEDRFNMKDRKALEQERTDI